MELSTVLGIVVILVIAVLLVKFLSKVVSFVFSAIGIVLVVWLVVIGMRYLDEQNIRDNFIDSNNLFLLQDGHNVITGFATHDNGQVDFAQVDEEMNNPNSPLYDKYYKVIFVNKESLPDKTSLMVGVSDEADRLSLFKNYVAHNFLEGDPTDLLIEEESQGSIEIHKETLAFRHGIKEVLSS